ncbi:MAG: tRNA 4-thiouridine(8) synthase ThiI [Ruminococcaceae bacterium]|nr:tRNA 4-thiouridine(8) synthase ThiI [Oscillospiraceae bacterium]
MKEIILCKYGEIVLKGANKKYFEDMLCRELKKRAKAYGSFDIYRAQSTIYIEATDDTADIDGMFEAARKVFGIVTVARAAVCEKNMEDIAKVVREYIPSFLKGLHTFKVEAKRSDKSFPLDSMEISREIGGVVLESCRGIRVDVHHPDVIVKVEIREFGAYVSAGSFKGAGGMPIGSNGRGLLLLSGGIDSPVAGYMLAKRGVKLEAVHFESFPYTSERAKEKVLDLAKLVAVYAGDIKVHIVSLTHIQEELVKNCEEDYFTLLLRRYMMTIAEKLAEKYNCGALITGESVGQVASQTMQAIGVTDNAVNIPVFRPCIGLDKEEIVQISRQINTFETSILPYEDCCTVFTPRHPKTRPELEKVLVQERKLDFDALVNEALESEYTEYVEAEY